MEEARPVDKYDKAVIPYGVHQMIGNVAEWYDKDYYTPPRPIETPRGPTRARRRCFAAGDGWTARPRCVSPCGTAPNPTVKINWLGFRAGFSQPSINPLSLLAPLFTCCKLVFL
jgi:iron(II)-dependent oxidoreductase